MGLPTVRCHADGRRDAARRLVAAWYFNPVALVGGALLTTWFVGALLYQAGWLRRPMPRPRGTAGRVVAGLLLLALVLFAVGRNLPFGPLAAFRV